MTARLVRKPRPCYSVQHLQNCCHETKSHPWVSQHLYSFASLQHVTCEVASQRESASGLSTASAVMSVVRFTCCKQLLELPIGCFLQDLPAPNIMFGAWMRWTRMHDVHVCKRMSFAGSAGSICRELFWKHKLVFTALVWIAGHVAPLKKCQLIETTIDNDIRTDLHAVACEFAFWTFTEKMVRTIQSRVVS